MQGQEMAKHISRGVNFCVVSKVPIVFESTGIRVLIREKSATLRTLLKMVYAPPVEILTIMIGRETIHNLESFCH